MHSHAIRSASPLARRRRRFQFSPLEFAPLEEIRDEMDRLWSEFTSSSTPSPWSAGWGAIAPTGRFPAVNMSETSDAIVIEAELPGLAASDLDVSIAGDELVLKGTRGAGKPEEAAQPESARRDGEPAGAGWLRRERGVGGFERRIELPVAVDPTKVEARLVDGVLTLTCAKAPECRPHKIEVRG